MRWGTGVGFSARRARASMSSSGAVAFLASARTVSALLLTGGVLVVLGKKGYILDLPFDVEKERMKKRRPFWRYSRCRAEGFPSGPLPGNWASAGTQ